MGIYELLPIDDPIRTLIMQQANAHTIKATAMERGLIEPAFHISLQAALIESGRSCPPHSDGPDNPFQPAPAQAR